MKMSIIKTTTKKSVIFKFDGFSEFYCAYVQGAFVGEFIVPTKYASMVSAGNELDILRSMHQCKTYGIILRGARRVE